MRSSNELRTKLILFFKKLWKYSSKNQKKLYKGLGPRELERLKIKKDMNLDKKNWNENLK